MGTLILAGCGCFVHRAEGYSEQTNHDRVYADTGCPHHSAVSAVLQRAPPGRSALRWAIGSPDMPRSSAWRLWGNKKGDFYVAVRSLGGITKASFHRDGRCQVGFTTDYADTASRRFAVKSRHWEKWRLPDDPVVRALQVLVPHSELRSFADRNRVADFIWLPTPPEGSVAVVSIAITAQGIELSLPGGAHAPIVVGSVPTTTRTVWLVYAHNPIDSAMAKLIDAERAKLKRLPGAESPPLGARAALWEHKEGHDRHVLELACH